jgi:hypothetical protein
LLYVFVPPCGKKEKEEEGKGKKGKEKVLSLHSVLALRFRFV